MACHEYKNYIKTKIVDTEPTSQTPPSKPFHHQLIQFQSEKIFECYFQLHDWQSYLAWHEEYKSILNENEDIESLKEQFENKIDLNYIKALSSFESYDFERAEKHILEVKRDMSLDNLSMWNLGNLEMVTLKEIFQSVILDSSLDERAKSLIEINQKILNMDEMAIWNSERVLLAQMIQLKKSQVFLTNSCHNI